MSGSGNSDMGPSASRDFDAVVCWLASNLLSDGERIHVCQHVT